LKPLAGYSLVFYDVSISVNYIVFDDVGISVN